MMKLSTMKKVMDTVDEHWKSPIAERILDRWGYDSGKYYCLRASANFIFVFLKEGRRYFLRFNDTCERDLRTIESEIKILQYLEKENLPVAKPVKSKDSRFVETVETELGTFYAVVFEGLQGKHPEFEELNNEQFFAWGSTLGKLHKALKTMPEELRFERASWKDHLASAQELLPCHETSAQKELEEISRWGESLNVSDDNFGLVHYDFELDNLVFENDMISILDFDDCSNYWFVADIAYALRDLFEDKVDLDNLQFQEFVAGYTKETEVDIVLLEQLSEFMRMHNIVTYAKLLKCVDIPESLDYPEWLSGLRKKLLDKIESYLASFEKEVLK
jgi:Ser/Thr protein kinase RdoA (MazF antagonist)